MVFAEKFMKGLVVTYSKSGYTPILGRSIGPLGLKILKGLTQDYLWLETPDVCRIVRDTPSCVYAQLRSLHENGFVLRRKVGPTLKRRAEFIQWKIADATRAEILAMKDDSKTA